jgi:hypothetical protein
MGRVYSPPERETNIPESFGSHVGETPRYLRVTGRHLRDVAPSKKLRGQGHPFRVLTSLQNPAPIHHKPLFSFFFFFFFEEKVFTGQGHAETNLRLAKRDTPVITLF